MPHGRSRTTNWSRRTSRRPPQSRSCSTASTPAKEPHDAPPVHRGPVGGHAVAVALAGVRREPGDAGTVGLRDHLRHRRRRRVPRHRHGASRAPGQLPRGDRRAAPGRGRRAGSRGPRGKRHR
ncbi:hypothetical protein PLANTIT3_60655 [Plantibacter sp. T3]|nr:hypothetical protein PLANTIT3_60655 [Plantibacter sp. T3]